jgi:hypothetical protein
VADLTVASGAVQMVAPALILGRVARDPDRLSGHLFATIGMFMVLAGATLHRATRQSDPDPVLLGWSAAQKMASSALLGVGVVRRTFLPAALPLAAFDLGSGLLCLAVRRNVVRT